MSAASYARGSVIGRRVGAYVLTSLVAAILALAWEGSDWEGAAVLLAFPVVLIVTILPYGIFRVLSAVQGWDSYAVAATGGLLCGAIAYALVVPASGQRYAVVVLELSLPFMLGLGALSGALCYWLEGRFGTRVTQWSEARYRSGVEVEVSATVAAPLDHTWAVFVPVDLRDLFKGHRPLPAVVGMSDQTGPWDRVGSARNVLLSDGRSLRETVTLVQMPEEGRAGFGYQVVGFSGLIGALTHEAAGDWSFQENAAEHTAISWRYTFLPRNPATRWVVLLIVRVLWLPYMTKALQSLDALVAPDGGTK